jgi:thioredoxin 1
MKNIKGMNEISEGLVLADFWATWCSPCKQMAPILDEIVTETGIKLVKIDVQEYQDLVEAFKIKNVPTLILLKDGQAMHTLVGIQTKSKILEWLIAAQNTNYVYKNQREDNIS